MKIIIIAIITVLILSGCSSTVSETGHESLPEQTTVSTKKKITGETEWQVIEVQALKYEYEQLTFEYKGSNYTMPLDRNDFKDDVVYANGMKIYSEQIINNRIGETVTAQLSVNEDMTKIRKCDVITPNGKLYSASEYRMTRKEGSVIELTNGSETFEADLNDLIISQKSNYPSVLDDVTFIGYRFSDGKVLLNQLIVAQTDINGNKEYVPMLNTSYPSFLGTVDSLDEGGATVILTDNITVCHIPIYYCESALSEGDRVMMILDSGLDLFQSGEEVSFDYAVILTEDEFSTGVRNFDDLAYAKADPNNLGRFIFTVKENME
ncbi:MAG: hypothetical protein IJ571_01655 [Ruminococcus sp.]|nr:hypothetical protein [Ruminococcus sp.]